MKQNSQSREKIKKSSFSIVRFLSGGVLQEGFLTKYGGMAALIVFMLFFFIANRYTCLLKMREIDVLQNELRDLKIRSVEISTNLTGSNRLSEIEKIVEQQHLELESATHPPYILTK
ncbi:MAG: hypothetical protein LBR50_05710 [Tannerella sp.]|jgi:hypothetical protein|nr:hypothetical protein [Tannerella sp.]